MSPRFSTISSYGKRTSDFVASAAHSAYSALIAPRSLDEDTRRKELILNVLLCVAGTLASIMTLILARNALMLGAAYGGMSPWIMCGYLAFLLALWKGSRGGSIRSVSRIFVASIFESIVYAAWQWGPDLPSVLLLSALLVVISSILLGNRVSFLVTIGLSATIISLRTLESKGFISPFTHWRIGIMTTENTLQYAATFLAIASVSWLSNREIGRSLSRARTSEKALAAERDSLEQTVMERTRSLRELQAEQMSELDRMAEFGQLSSGIFHDLINPLSAVHLNIEALSRTSSTDSEGMQEVRGHINRAMQASQRMERLMSAVRRRMQSREIREAFDPAEEIERATALLQYKARAAQVMLDLSLSKELVLMGNPLTFEQVATNLISNAIDAYEKAKKDGVRKRVIIACSQDARGQGASGIVFCVSDFGSGIESEALKHIFEPFFTTKAIDRGSGIGLSTAKRIVEREFGGTIAVSTDVGKGSSFTVRIPCRSS